MVRLERLRVIGQRDWVVIRRIGRMRHVGLIEIRRRDRGIKNNIVINIICHVYQHRIIIRY